MSFGLQSEENEQSHMIARDAIQVRFGHYHLIQTRNFDKPKSISEYVEAHL